MNDDKPKMVDKRENVVYFWVAANQKCVLARSKRDPESLKWDPASLKWIPAGPSGFRQDRVDFCGSH